MFLRTVYILQGHGTVTAIVRYVRQGSVFRRAHVLLTTDLAPQSDEIVQPPQVPVFVVPLHPGRPMIDRYSRRKGNSLSKVYEVDTAEICAVVHKQERASNNLLIGRREGEGRTGEGRRGEGRGGEERIG